VKIEASFIRSAASASDLPRDGLDEIALVGRSNVGKSSLINALVRQKIARTSAAPGKTRLANIYRVARGGRPPLYLVDLPGYGYARGDRADLEAATRAFFGREGLEGRERQEEKSEPDLPGYQASPAHIAAVLLVDTRHPGLESDRAAWQWLTASVESCAVAATKIDKLARGERIRALRELESVFETSVLPVSAVTGEGLDELWTLIDRLPTNRPPRPRNSSPPRKGTAPRRPRRKS
jgi:GTP-binding protein